MAAPGGPVMRVTAPLPAAHLVESRIINIPQLHIMIASKVKSNSIKRRRGFA